MKRKALYDAAGVLKSHGFVDFQPGLGELVRDVLDDFALEPGKWRWDGIQHVVFTPPPAPRELDLAALHQAVDDLVGDGTVPLRIRAFVAALKKVIA